jgi:hypothetical protein
MDDFKPAIGRIAAWARPQAGAALARDENGGTLEPAVLWIGQNLSSTPVAESRHGWGFSDGAVFPAYCGDHCEFTAPHDGSECGQGVALFPFEIPYPSNAQRDSLRCPRPSRESRAQLSLKTAHCASTSDVVVSAAMRETR